MRIRARFVRATSAAASRGFGVGKQLKKSRRALAPLKILEIDDASESALIAGEHLPAEAGMAETAEVSRKKSNWHGRCRSRDSVLEIGRQYDTLMEKPEMQ
jgi:hypothetical protein